MPEQALNGERQYIYCIIRSPEPRRFAVAPVGGNGAAVHTVHYRDLAAVVSDAALARYDISRQNTLAHELVVEHVLQDSVVLPVRFGTVARGADEIQERLLKRRFGELHGLLQSMSGKVELGLKVLWNRSVVFAEIVDEDVHIRQLRDLLQDKPERETHYPRIELGQRVEEAMVRKRDEEADLLLRELRPLAVDTRINKVLMDTMVLNAAFLVESRREAEFDAAVERIATASTGRLSVKYVGPLPPFNFVNLVVRWDAED